MEDEVVMVIKLKLRFLQGLDQGSTVMYVDHTIYYCVGYFNRCIERYAVSLCFYGIRLEISPGI